MERLLALEKKARLVCVCVFVGVCVCVWVGVRAWVCVRACVLQPFLVLFVTLPVARNAISGHVYVLLAAFAKDEKGGDFC